MKTPIIPNLSLRYRKLPSIRKQFFDILSQERHLPGSRATQAETAREQDGRRRETDPERGALTRRPRKGGGTSEVNP
jgi:hypothetical protein